MKSFKISLAENWKLKSSEEVVETGNLLSTDENISRNWLSTSIPSTVLGALVKNKICADPYFGDNLKNIPTHQFEVAWWYVSDFYLDEKNENQYANLKFDGVNYKANVWLNGELIADDTIIEGAYRRFSFDISQNIKAGKNLLAVAVTPPKPGDFSTGFVDWNPAPPDGNMGIFRPVTIELHRGVRVENIFVQTDLPQLQKAKLTISAELYNDTEDPVTGRLIAKIEDIECSVAVNIDARSQTTVTFSPDDFQQLVINNPRLWWPVHLGEPNLYEIKISFESNNQVSNSKQTTFGIRKVSDYWLNNIHRGFKINGKKLLIKGAGWTDDLLLMDTHENIETQIRYVKQMNLNCIRLEGFWGKDQQLYNLCDQYGILLMVGWSCHWEHEIHMGVAVDERFGGVHKPKDIAHVSQAWQDQVIWLRNHPSIFVWTVASDKVPITELEQKYIETFVKFDATRPYLNSTGGVGSDQHVIGSEDVISEISGCSGVKMLGPYAYTAPAYWYTDTKFGGAYGFNTETGPGAQVPQLDSLKKFIPKNKLWPINDLWNYHCGRYEFSDLSRFTSALNERYGASESLEEFDVKAQALNYELMRPMFEAFQVNKKKATGIVHWMLNSAWPKMYWQLYDYYLRPTGAFYGAQKACAPLNLIYNYGDQHIYLINDHSKAFENLNVSIQVYDIHSKLLSKEEKVVEAQPDSSTRIDKIYLPKDISTTYFVDLRLTNSEDRAIVNNFYWLSTKEELLDYEADLGEFAFHTPSKQFSDLTLLAKMEKVDLAATYSFEMHETLQWVIVELENISPSIAFLVNLELVDAAGVILAPVFWEDNFISLLPKEKRIVRANFESQERMQLNIKGWNVQQISYTAKSENLVID